MTALLFAAPLITRDSTAHSLSPASPCMKIVYGLELKGATAQLQKALLWLNQNEQITPTASDYLQAAIIKAAARKQGSIVELPDCLIAAVAIRLGLPLVTGNTEDFQAIQKNGVALHIENWRNP
jgi:predicted nucleic acid-binding protein